MSETDRKEKGEPKSERQNKECKADKKKRKEKEGKVERPRKTTLAWQARAPKKDRLKHFSQLKWLELKKINKDIMWGGVLTYVFGKRSIR